jgi:predicted component of type VI protein secretion system
MALAIVLDEMVRSGKVASHAELARIGHVSRSRLVQIMSLVNLAPDVQEAVLFLPAAVSSTDPVTERQLQQVVAAADWEAQRSLWRRLTHQITAPPPIL